ncbi:hypothetical protein B1756_06320 [Natrarchaeobaculum aegyptiacum]|uniref:Uncharacterized protein n=1 Tax=Natrarchaeobaculum aegyptiacum TaxID=745377 RepID=A0A2Z2HQK4_9EURY|nr:hypothetical protein B1756_06320 [Natrarchaeobaculum aegyptiacum]
MIVSKLYLSIYICIYISFGYYYWILCPMMFDVGIDSISRCGWSTLFREKSHDRDGLSVVPDRDLLATVHGDVVLTADGSDIELKTELEFSTDAAHLLDEKTTDDDKQASLTHPIDVAIVPEVVGADVLGEVGTRLDHVLKHSLDSALFGRIRAQVLARECRLFFFQFAVVLFDLLEFHRDDSFVSHASHAPRFDR